ncbi:MAG TPA: CBS domain-containing protein [Acidimicrobiales bacterium]|nr:CBS domain-containing protein [Acidimicrobiales bacterium]
MKIGKLLDGKGHFVATVPPEASVWDALALLERHKVGALVVSADGRRPDGIVSERDIVRSLHERGPTVLEGPVADIMVGEVRCASPDEDVESLMAVMTTHRIRHVPVVEDSSLVGIVSIGDVVKQRLDALEDDNRALVDFIHAR